MSPLGGKKIKIIKSTLLRYIYINNCVINTVGKVLNDATTATVINWFKNLADKDRHKFIKFDISEFYPSISGNLSNKSIEFTKSFTKIKGNTINAI